MKKKENEKILVKVTFTDEEMDELCDQFREMIKENATLFVEDPNSDTVRMMTLGFFVGLTEMREAYRRYIQELQDPDKYDECYALHIAILRHETKRWLEEDADEVTRKDFLYNKKKKMRDEAH